MSDERSEERVGLNDLLCVTWHDIHSGWKFRMFRGLEYRPCWFVVEGEVHKGEGNGKFFYSEDDGCNYCENDVQAFSKRIPDARPTYT